MKIPLGRSLRAGLGLLLVGAVLLSPPPVRAEDDPLEKALAEKETAVVYDVRVVRVDPSDRTVVEAPPPWQPGGASGATTRTKWADLLSSLKGRGRTTLIAEQRVTVSHGRPASMNQLLTRPVRQFERQDTANEFWRSATADTGASAELTLLGGLVQYSVVASWEGMAPGSGDRAPPSTSRAQWKGTSARPVAGETLVLFHRDQIGAVGTEVYVLVTGWHPEASER